MEDVELEVHAICGGDNVHKEKPATASTASARDFIRMRSLTPGTVNRPNRTARWQTMGQVGALPLTASHRF